MSKRFDSSAERASFDFGSRFEEAHMPTKVKNSVVVITGGSSGIGRATALEFARKGAHVIAGARREDALRRLETEAESMRGSVAGIAIDVTNDDHVRKLAQRALDDYGRIDVWVNNAVVTAFGRVDQVPLEDFRRLWDVNVMGYVHGIRAVLPHMRRRNSGVIVNVSSVVGRVGQPYATAYTMTKHAIRALSIGLRQELLVDGMDGIDVCTIMPGSTDTPLFQHGANYTGWRAKPMSPVYPPEKVARAIVACAQSPAPEVFVGGAPRMMNLQAQWAPRVAERVLARQVDKEHFDKKVPSERSAGNLYIPSADAGETTGGWGGRKGLTVRRAATLGLGALGTVWALRRAG
jgi:NAD(P)-dependent dehydrogenase (short-subunit alcohol dehydrogenase family)